MRNPSPVRTTAGGTDTARRVERLPNGHWRIDWRSGLVSVHDVDPNPYLQRGIAPPHR